MDLEKVFANYIDCKKILGDSYHILLEKHIADVTKEFNGKMSVEKIEKEAQRRLRIDAMWVNANRIPVFN